LATVMSLREGKVSAIGTYLSDVSPDWRAASD
jgi:hypothetical protein